MPASLSGVKVVHIVLQGTRRPLLPTGTHLTEFGMLLQLRHPNITHVFDAFEYLQPGAAAQISNKRQPASYSASRSTVSPNSCS